MNLLTLCIPVFGKRLIDQPVIRNKIASMVCDAYIDFTLLINHWTRVDLCPGAGPELVGEHYLPDVQHALPGTIR